MAVGPSIRHGRFDFLQKHHWGNLVTTTVTGVNESLLEIKLYKRNLQKGLNEGHNDALDYLVVQVKRITPYATGELRRSVKAIKSDFGFTGNKFIKRGYIVATAAHAVYVHEDLTKYHKPPTSAKFIEKIVNDPRHKMVAASLTAAKARKYI
jgi:hypothetical protein